MAKAKKSDGPTANDQLVSFLKSHKDDHYNFEDTIHWKSSQGSLALDLHVGKITPGIIRHTGVARGGKTSQFLEDVRNFLKTVPNSRALWVLAEGRLGEKMRQRSGLKFTSDPEEWEDGSVFILESQVYETVFDLIRELIKNNPENKRYFFVIDSSNGLKRKDDLNKVTSEAQQVAGGALLTSDFMSRVSLAMSKRGHVLGIIGQVRTKIKVDKYEKGTPTLSNASGGSAQDHYPTIFLEYQPRYKKDLIGDEKDPAGHWCRVKVIKTDNEKTMEVSYPIKYNKRDGEGSVWVEYEIADLLIQWEMVEKKGAWLSFSNELIKELREVMDIEDDFKIQGVEKLMNWLEENTPAKEYLYEKFINLIS